LTIPEFGRKIFIGSFGVPGRHLFCSGSAGGLNLKLNRNDEIAKNEYDEEK
jgi:hypothetical protein